MITIKYPIKGSVFTSPYRQVLSNKLADLAIDREVSKLGCYSACRRVVE